MNQDELFVKPPKQKVLQVAGKRLSAWEGYVRFNKISGWVENPRISLEAKKKKDAVGDRPLTQDEVFEIMKSVKDFRINELSKDIRANGLKEPIILSATSRLVDGNRRYFAIRLLLENTPKSDPNRADFERVHAYVLDESCSDTDENLVLVQENFHPSLKLEWQDYVKAQYIEEALDEGLTDKEVAERFNWKVPKVRETKRILEIIEEFLQFAQDEPNEEDDLGGGLGLTENEAESVAASNYQYFNEVQKSFFKEFRADIEFKVQFFRWIVDGKFRNFNEVRVARSVWEDEEAREIIGSDAPTAAKEAKAVIDYKKRIITRKAEVPIRVEEFIRYLESLSATQIGALTDEVTARLRYAMDLVEAMAKSVVDSD